MLNGEVMSLMGENSRLAQDGGVSNQTYSIVLTETIDTATQPEIEIVNNCYAVRVKFARKCSTFESVGKKPRYSSLNMVFILIF